MIAQLGSRSPFLLTVGLLVLALLFFGRRFLARFRKNNPKKKNDMVSNPGMVRITAILGIAFALIVLGFALYAGFASLLARP